MAFSLLIVRCVPLIVTDSFDSDRFIIQTYPLCSKNRRLPRSL